MKFVLKKVIIAGGSLVLLIAGSAAGMRWWLEGKLSKEAVVAQMESSWNCRAQIDSVTLLLMSSPARLEVVGCKIAPRDAEVAKPFAQRAPLSDGTAQVSVARAVLELKLQDLVSHRLNVQQLLLSDIGVSEDVPKDGESSLAVLFSKPGAEAQEAVVVVSEAKPAAAQSAAVAVQQPVDKTPEPPLAKESAPVSSPPKIVAAKKEPEVFVASQLGFSINVRRASLEHVNFHRVDHNNTSKTDISDLSFSINEIDVNPADLANHNCFKLALNGRLKQRGRIGPKDARREVTMADVLLDGDGIVNPFDVQSGKWQATSNLRLTMKKDSVLGGYMKLGETGSKDLKKLDDYGIDLSDLSLGGPLLEDANILVGFQQDRITLQEDARFAMPDFELMLLKGSWLNAADDESEMQIRITCGQKLQEQLTAGVVKLLGKETGESVVKSLCDEKGRLYFDMLSTGKLSKPNVKPDVRRLINRVIEGIGGGLLDGLLKK